MLTTEAMGRLDRLERLQSVEEIKGHVRLRALCLDIRASGPLPDQSAKAGEPLPPQELKSATLRRRADRFVPSSAASLPFVVNDLVELDDDPHVHATTDWAHTDRTSVCVARMALYEDCGLRCEDDRRRIVGRRHHLSWHGFPAPVYPCRQEPKVSTGGDTSA